MDTTKNPFSKIGLGTVQLGIPYGIGNQTGQPSQGEAFQILQKAAELGITILDTASAYGESEVIIGESKFEKFKIISKWKDNPISSLEESLQKLRKASLYGWLAHSGQALIDKKELWEQMKRQKDLGKVTRIGYSLYSPAELEHLLNESMIPEIVQLPCNILDRRFVPWFRELERLGCEIHCRSLFLQGLFFRDYKSLPNFFDPIKPWLSKVQDYLPDRLERIKVLLDAVLQYPSVSKVIIGIEKTDQLIDLEKAVQINTCKNLEALPFLPMEIINPAKWPN